jgi:hypothetical protein
MFSSGYARVISGAVITKDGEMTNEKAGQQPLTHAVHQAAEALERAQIAAMELGRIAISPTSGRFANTYKRYLDPGPGVKSVSRRYMTDEMTSSGSTPQCTIVKLSDEPPSGPAKAGLAEPLDTNTMMAEDVKAPAKKHSDLHCRDRKRQPR